jgi:hypothetical protein
MGFGNKFVWTCDEIGCTEHGNIDNTVQDISGAGMALSNADWLMAGTKCYCPIHASNHREGL